VNYALEPWELEKGFILTCQSTPKTKSLVICSDETYPCGGGGVRAANN
jgi:ring-1,2-phenylacetyl-CoA epoxidase subunit PaaE